MNMLCVECGKEYCNRISLNRHRKKIHGLPPLLLSDENDTLYDFIFYMHTCHINNKRYIGATTQSSIEKRWKNGTGYRFNKELNSDIHKYGVKSFSSVELMRKSCTISEAKRTEEMLISHYKPEYNKSTTGIKIISPNANKKAVEKIKEDKETALRVVQSCLEWQKNNPQKALDIRRKNATKATNARKKMVVCIETGVVYESASEAARQTGSLQAKITECCRGNRKSTNNLHWKYF